jgi:hypothetical protein
MRHAAEGAAHSTCNASASHPQTETINVAVASRAAIRIRRSG